MKNNFDISNRRKMGFGWNPLAHLGWLGFLGILGILFVPVFIPFLLFFPFFSYSKSTADELFWQNVHRSGVRAFWSVFVLDIAVAFILFVRGMWHSFGAAGVEYPKTVEFQDRTVLMNYFTFDQYMITFLMFFVSIYVMILVFVISMMKFRKQERKILKEEDDLF